ncbi:hypothetical protein CDAR_181371 [Caerostris darwini]|uniref:Uncharacterized protein n=1 Tax=Caerostris darwini TaxID=1538125 RepID=A0AAV4U402_9ARAC|nr:hypothetical protein CDAR_181371 [Caerostris darwini]
MIRGVGIDQSVRYTPSRVLTAGVRGVSRQIIPGQMIGGTPNIQGENIRFLLGNTAGTVGTIPVAGQGIQVQPKSQIAAPLNLKHQSEEDIIQLNRQLMQKQNEEEIKRALTGMVNTDSDIGSITFSANQLGDVSRRLGSDVLTPALPGAEQRRPDQAQPALPRPQQRRPSQLQPARPGPQQIRPNQRQPARPGPQQRRPDQIQPALPVPQQRRPGQANPSLPLPQQRRPSQVQPARPGSPQRRPDQIRRRIPIAPQPAVIGGGLGMIRGVDQSVRYTPSRVLTTGVRGVSRPIIPGQIIGGTPNIQGENIRFMLGNTAGTVGTIPVVGQGIQVQPKPQISAPLNLKPGSEEDIIQLNRQLMKKQNEEEIKRALTGMVNNDSDIGSITFSADQLGDVSRRLGSDVLTPALPGAEQRRPDQVQPALPRPQQRRPSQVQPARPLPQQRIPNQRQPAPPGPQQRRPDQVRRVTPAAVGQRIPLAPQPALTAPVLPNIPRLPKQEFGEDIIQLNKQLMQKQNEEEIKRALAGIVGADTDIGSISLTETDLADVSRRLGGDSLAPVIPAPQQRRPDQLRPAIPAPQQRRPDQVLPAIPAPQQRRPDQVQPAIPAPQQRKPEQIRRVKPATTGQRIPVIPKPGLIGTNSGAINNLNQIVRYNTIGSVPGSQRRIISGQVIPTTPVILGGNVVPGLGNALGPVGAVRYSVPKPMISPQIIPRPEISAAVLPKPDLDEGIIHFNRELMLKINEEELRQALSGVLKPHSDINKLSLTADEFDEISRQLSYTPQVIPVPTLTRISSDSARQRFGAGIRTVASDGLIPGNVLITPGSQILDAQRSADFGKRQIQTQVINEVQEKIRQDQIEPPVELQQRIEPTIPAINVIGNRFSQIKEPIVKFSPVEPSANTPVIKTVQSNLDSGDSQMQVKVDDVIEQTQLKRVVHPVQSRLSLESLSQKYLQEKIPIDVPSYVPLPSFMAPFNYRVPHLRTPIVQQQEKLDQILV